MASNRHDNLDIRIAIISRGDRGKATNTTWNWAKLRDRLSSPAIDHEHTVEQYRDANTNVRNKLKDVGAFVGGPVADGVRKRENMLERTIVTLDIDDAHPSEIPQLKFGLSPISDYEWFASTTRSHTTQRPKYRLILPLTRSITAEEYGPLSRILGSKVFEGVQPSMDAVDVVSFRVAQIMYWPSRNSDGTFDTIYNPGAICDPDKVLSAFGNWQDWTQLPYSEKKGQKRPGGTKKAENPTEKRGIVGAFCRAYDIHQAIKTFLPDTYIDLDSRSTKPRYTYAKGTGSHGAVVEDGGLFIYSNHGSDPCGDRLVNAFDMVRLHRFAELDEGDEPENPKSAASYKAMEREYSGDSRVAAEIVKDQFDADAMFDDLDDLEEPESPKQVEAKPKNRFDSLLDDAVVPSLDWMTALEKDKDGSIKPTLTNLTIIIQNDKRTHGVVEVNEFTEEVVTRRPLRTKMDIIPRMPILDKVNGDLWSDRHDACVRTLIEASAGKGGKGYGLKVTDRDLRDAIDIAAAKKAFHPVREYLSGLKWDGNARVEHLFINYLGAIDTPYTRAIARMTMLGAVVRVFEPGHKFDFVTIMEGLQGKRKSTFIATLARHWFVEIQGNLEDRKQLVEKMQGAWIMELPELSVFGRAEIEDIKAFVSAGSDKVRLSYDRRARKFKRQCIFMGSTNNSEYLRDPTGGRRFWPVVCHVDDINTPLLEREIDQIWAETVVLYQQMRQEHPTGILPLYLSDDAVKAEALEMQESRRVETAEDGLAGRLGAWLERIVNRSSIVRDETGFDDLDDGADDKVQRTETCLLELWCEALGNDLRSYNDASARLLGRAMKLIPGWHMFGTRTALRYGRQKVYRLKMAHSFPCQSIT